LDLCFLTKQLIAKDTQVCTGHYQEIISRVHRSKTLWLVSEDSATARTARMYLYAGFVRSLWGQDYQPWYLASTFTL
jgi:hypothetical protein